VDQVDALIAAYTAAYWWRFGIRRSTMAGDLKTGYIVTPHSARTFTALSGVFHKRLNPGPKPAPPPEPKAPIPIPLPIPTIIRWDGDYC
jgi:hypothetical protein